VAVSPNRIVAETIDPLSVGEEFQAPDIQIAGAFGAHPICADVVHTPRWLAAVGKQFLTIGLLVNHGVMIVDVAILLASPDLPAADALSPHGKFIFHDPGTKIKHMLMPFDNGTPGEPSDVGPAPD
jgi:hypothetical protein